VIRSDDGCADVICPKHSFLVRIIVGGAMLCKKCGRWRVAEDQSKAHKRLMARERKRRSRDRRRSTKEAGLGAEDVTLTGSQDQPFTDTELSRSGF
jgi:hypothetical protein